MNLKEWLTTLKSGLAQITIEPTLVLYMMAYMTTNVVEQAFFIDKACRVNHGFNASICEHINAAENEVFNKEVQVKPHFYNVISFVIYSYTLDHFLKQFCINLQVTVSEFHQWNDIAGHVVPIVLALFMGAWSDKRGRKLPLLLGLLGKVYYSTMIVLNTTQNTWPVENIIYTATLPSALTGADVAIFAAAFAYISDITTQKSRTLRVTILEVCYLAAMPAGIALGKKSSMCK